MNTKKVLLSLLISVNVAHAFAQTESKEWNLQQCIEQALQTNLQL